MNLRAFRSARMAEDPTKPTKLVPEDRSLWNGFVDFMEQSGMKGSPDLDNRDLNLSKQMWQKYTQSIGKEVNYDEFVPKVQDFISNYRNLAITDARAGKTVIPGVLDYTGKNKVDVGDEALDQKFMAGLSKVDGWAGSKTTSWKFPSEYMMDAKTGQPTDRPNSIYEKMGVQVSPQRFRGSRK